VPVLGNIVLEEELLESAKGRGFRDVIDLDLCVKIGFSTDGKARLVTPLGPGIVIGVEAAGLNFTHRYTRIHPIEFIPLVRIKQGQSPTSNSRFLMPG
jgi:hypothetical protein